MTITAIRVQYCASCTTRTDTAARKGSVQKQQHNISNQVPRKRQSSIRRGSDKDALQEIAHRTQLTIISLNHPYTTEDRTKPYWDKLVKDLVKDYKENRIWMYRSQRFSSRGCLDEGLHCGHKGKGHATEAVTITEKLTPDNIKDDLDEA